MVRLEPDATCDARVIAVAGIARPERFFAALRAQGCDVVRTFAFGDHHWFTRPDVERLERAASEANVTLIVTTEKDGVRLEPVVDGSDHESTPRDPRAPVWLQLPLQITIEPADEFSTWLQRRL